QSRGLRLKSPTLRVGTRTPNYARRRNPAGSRGIGIGSCAPARLECCSEPRGASNRPKIPWLILPRTRHDFDGAPAQLASNSSRPGCGLPYAPAIGLMVMQCVTIPCFGEERTLVLRRGILALPMSQMGHKRRFRDVRDASLYLRLRKECCSA